MLLFLKTRCVFLCCSAVVLGAGKLCLEPVLCREEAVTSQHRNQPHDLRPLPHPHKAEHRGTQGKHTNAKLSPITAVRLINALPSAAGVLCCLSSQMWCYVVLMLLCQLLFHSCCSLISWEAVIDDLDFLFVLADNVGYLSKQQSLWR